MSDMRRSYAIDYKLLLKTRIKVFENVEMHDANIVTCNNAGFAYHKSSS